MRRALVLLIGIGALLALAWGGTAAAEVRQNGNLRISFDGSFAPRALPRDRPAPVTVKIEGNVSTTDGTQPPPLRRLEVALNRHGRLFSQGLPVCRAAELQSTSTQQALARCRGAFVGHGSFHTSLQFGASPLIPSDGSILAFNSRKGGGPAILLHLYGTAPVHATFVLSLAITHRDDGDFGTVLSMRIPRIAGVGSITGIELEVGRRYSFRGKTRSYLSASCAAPPGFPGTIFPFLRGSFVFAGGRTFSTPLVDNCQVR